MAKIDEASENRYDTIFRDLFNSHTADGSTEFEFSREELLAICKKHNIETPKNIGDVLYNFRYRSGGIPKWIRPLTPTGKQWICVGAGKGRYRAILTTEFDLTPTKGKLRVLVPDSTPEIIKAYAKSDEQATLAKIRYNRLVDLFLGINAFSLQNHLRTSVKDLGQIEIDEIYTGVDHRGAQFVIPVQAKGGKDQHNVVQTLQDVAFCREAYPNLVIKPISAHYLKEEDVIAMFELCCTGYEVNIVHEQHYKLVTANSITGEDLERFRRSPFLTRG